MASLGGFTGASARTFEPAVFQYTVPVATSKSPSVAFLWLPPAAERLRGAVVVGMTLMERELVQDPTIRRACADEQLAIVYLKCNLGAANIPVVLAELADKSGYRELAQVPLFFIGHSAGGPAAKSWAITLASRCFGVMQFRGGVPGGEERVPPGVPALVMLGQFDEFAGLMIDRHGKESWEAVAGEVSAYRATDRRHLVSVVVEPGAGHFAWSSRSADYLALFLRKAARARISKSPPETPDAPAMCLEIDPAQGWLTGQDLRSAPQEGAFAASGTEADASAWWHFDREMAHATLAHHGGMFGKKDQFIRWNDAYTVESGARFFFSNITWVGDGQTFEVHPVYADHYPAQYEKQGPQWLRAGEPVGHSTAPIQLRGVGGPVVPMGANRFRIGYSGLAPVGESSRIVFLASSEGDAEYRYTEHVGMLPRGQAGSKTGQTQTLTFPDPGPLTVGGPPVKLAATTDANLPVEYYVAFGPATIVEGQLLLSELPARARLPIQIKVVAYQFGRMIEPLVQSAAPVERVVIVHAPLPASR